jgi:hypothetical protein
MTHGAGQEKIIWAKKRHFGLSHVRERTFSDFASQSPVRFEEKMALPVVLCIDIMQFRNTVREAIVLDAEPAPVRQPQPVIRLGDEDSQRAATAEADWSVDIDEWLNIL